MFNTLHSLFIPLAINSDAGFLGQVEYLPNLNSSAFVDLNLIQLGIQLAASRKTKPYYNDLNK